MKIENNNKEVIKRITNRSLKTNKIRNIFAVLAIILTTFMISSVFSIGISFAKNYKTMNLRLAGTSADIYLANPTKEQIAGIEDLYIFKSIGIEINAGKVDLAVLSENKTKILLKYYDDDNFKKQISPALGNIKGNYPIKENDIMISRLALELLGESNIEIGDKIEVPCKINGESINKKFIISGIFDSYKLVEDTGYIYVSESFIKENNLNAEENGIISMTTKSNYKNTASDILGEKIKLNNNQKFDYSYNVDDLGETVLSMALVVIIIVLFIILSGYLLIYNVLYIAVTKDINFYGLLKTIGTSPKQIKKIVKGQALRLSLIGIPIGLALGGIISFIVVPAVMGLFFSGISATAMPTKVSFSPIIFILTALFSFLTVVLSCRKPAKMASNISPVEAMRYTGSTVRKQKKNRRTTNGGKLYKMAWYNVFRDRKRAVLVFLSLFMGIITFLSVYTFVDSLKVENYIDRYVPNDFELQNVDAEEGKMDDSVINDIKEMTGVDRIDTFKLGRLRLTMSDEVILPALKECYSRFGYNEDDIKNFIDNVKTNPEFMDASVISIDDNISEFIFERNKEKFDLQAFKEGKLILIDDWYYGENYQDVKGDLTITNPDTNQFATYDTQVIKFNDNYLPDGLAGPLGIPTIYMSKSALENLDNKASNYISYIQVNEKYEPQIKADLGTIAKNRGLSLEAKTTKTEEFEKSSMVEKILGGGISLILILIGILNFINVMITGVNLRLKKSWL